MEKEPSLPVTSSKEETTPSRPPRRTPKLAIRLIALTALLLYSYRLYTNLYPASDCHSSPIYTPVQLAGAKCPPQPSPLARGKSWDILHDTPFAELAARRLSKAVQIPTESFDDLPLNASDPLYDKFFALSHFIEVEYSKLFADPIKHEYVNTHGHLFTWSGSNPALKPVVLMAHTDTVPVLPATLHQWTYPPFEGTISVNGTADTPGTWIWGRGSSDCKNSLLGIYAAVERLVTEGYQPERTILIANGFDEEIGGPRGAAKLSELIESRYGKDSIAFALDEGFSGISHEYGATVATFGMAEKGSLNVNIRVETPGGHSSVPPPHTGIGILSLLLARLESHPFKPVLDPSGPYLKYLSCLSDYAPAFPSSLKKQVRNPKAWPKLAKKLASKDRIVNSFLATTQAIDLIKGGVKVNALPEVVEATVNHRISFTSSINETIAHVKHVLEPYIRSLNFTYTSFDDSPKSSVHHVTLYIPSTKSLEPAPISPATDPSFALMGSTVKDVFGSDTVVSPTGMYANTDTNRFWGLTNNIYRFTPALISENLHQHTVDERISLAAHLNTTVFYYQLIQNLNGWQ